jgi:hypothetical protein
MFKKNPYKRLSVEDMEFLCSAMAGIDKEIESLQNDEEKVDYLQRALKSLFLGKEGRFVLRFIYGLGGFKSPPKMFKNDREKGFEEGVRFVGDFFFKNYLDALQIVERDF